jgi:hypothetical protein
MRIQEMRSGLTHLRKRTDGEPVPPDNELRLVGGTEFEEPQHIVDECDLDKSSWSLVSFETVEAGGLTYLQAVKLRSELHAIGISGLCIVTDDAASRRLS